MLINIKRNFKNIPGWSTGRKILVIESDDWGSVRMPSKAVYNILLSAGIEVDKCPYSRFDSLASEEDLDSLFKVLSKFRDRNGVHPVITANTIVANPNFHEIKRSNYKEYHYELFTDTLKSYPSHTNSFSFWKEGMTRGVFHPQFHGREHLNVNLWLKMLQKGSNETLLAFENNLFGISSTITKEERKSYLASLEFEDYSELEWQRNMLSEGLDLFESIFGFRSSSFIAPNYTWHSSLEPSLLDNGVDYLQGIRVQFQPEAGSVLKKSHIIGSINSSGQIYLIRNCVFDPSLNRNINWVKSTLEEIQAAFFWRKPAIISSHRLNYIGFIDQENRNRNLILLELLLKEICKTWPNVEFMSSDQLGKLITETRK